MKKSKDRVFQDLVNVVISLNDRVEALERKVESSLLWHITYKDGEMLKKVTWEPAKSGDGKKFGHPLGRKKR